MNRAIALPAAVQQLLTRLHTAGFAAYVVGGCVRDSLRGCTPTDWDVATAAQPAQVQALFSDCHVIPTGLQHGTVTVHMGDRCVEVTTFRQDGDYRDGRHPHAVRFVGDIAADLKRRDFTINAMAYSDTDGLLDLFDGQADLAAKRLRCVGDPAARLDEDALRILRGLRFCAVLGLTPDATTAQALHDARTHLHAVSAERVAAELTKLLCGDGAAEILRAYRDVLAVVVPELAPTFDFAQHTPHHRFDVYEHTLRTVAAAPANAALRWAALLHDSAKPACFSLDEQGAGHFYGHAAAGESVARQVLTRLHMERRLIDEVTTLIRLHDRPLTPTPAAVKRLLHRLGEPTLRHLLALQRADANACGQIPHPYIAVADEAERVLDTVLREAACVSLHDLAVKGNDLMAIGAPAGPQMRQLLQQLLDAVMDERCANDRAALLQLAGEFLGNEEST